MAGQNYTIEATTNLNSANRFCVLVTNAMSNPFSITDSHATNGSRFYRAQRAVRAEFEGMRSKKRKKG